MLRSKNHQFSLTWVFCVVVFWSQIWRGISCQKEEGDTSLFPKSLLKSMLKTQEDIAFSLLKLTEDSPTAAEGPGSLMMDRLMTNLLTVGDHDKAAEASAIEPSTLDLKDDANNTITTDTNNKEEESFEASMTQVVLSLRNLGSRGRSVLSNWLGRLLNNPEVTSVTQILARHQNNGIVGPISTAARAKFSLARNLASYKLNLHRAIGRFAFRAVPPILKVQLRIVNVLIGLLERKDMSAFVRFVRTLHIRLLSGKRSLLMNLLDFGTRAGGAGQSSPGVVGPGMSAYVYDDPTADIKNHPDFTSESPSTLDTAEEDVVPSDISFAQMSPKPDANAKVHASAQVDPIVSQSQLRNVLSLRSTELTSGERPIRYVRNLMRIPKGGSTLTNPFHLEQLEHEHFVEETQGYIWEKMMPQTSY